MLMPLILLVQKRQLQHANLEKKILNKEQDEICIQVPNYRLLPIKDQPAQLEASGDPTAGEAAYIRLRGQTQDEIDNAVDYDLDSEDELWLNKRNAKVLTQLIFSPEKLPNPEQGIPIRSWISEYMVFTAASISVLGD